VIQDPFVRKLTDHVDFLPVCPEVSLGLGVPRFPIRIVTQRDRVRLLQPATGRDVTDDMDQFCGNFLSTLGEVDGFILKFRSPSCGLKDVRVYAKSERAPLPLLAKAQDFSVGRF
jgi:uncharacterized protein YbbK (DUF523 family)